MRQRRRVFAVIAVLAIAASGAVWWRDGGKRLFFPRNWEEVEPGVFRSGQIHRSLIEKLLREHRIDLVIDLARDHWKDVDDREEREAAARLGVRLLSLRRLSGDGTGDPRDYVDALSALVEARRSGQRVLVHCRGGSERTGNFFQLYRTLVERWSAEDALAEDARFRNEPLKQSRSAAYLDAHMEEIAEGLVARGALRSAPDPLPAFGPALLAVSAAR
jgi:hypothetical protein